MQNSKQNKIEKINKCQLKYYASQINKKHKKLQKTGL